MSRPPPTCGNCLHNRRNIPWRVGEWREVPGWGMCAHPILGDRITGMGIPSRVMPLTASCSDHEGDET